MQLLIWLTLAYAAVLVAALAIGLTLILVHLWRIRAALKPVAAALQQVDERSIRLAPFAASILETLSGVRREISYAADAVEGAGGVLGIEPPQPPIIQAHAVARWQGGGS